MGEAWPIKNPMDAAEALDWLRRRMKGNGLLLIAVSPNSLAFSKDPELHTGDAIDILRDELETLQAGLDGLRAKRVTRDVARRRG